MKRNKSLSAVFSLVVLLAFGAFSPLIYGADTTISLNIQAGSPEGKRDQAATIGWLAQELRQNGWNVILSPEVEKIPITELKLKNAEANLVAEAITIATGGSVRASVRQDNSLFLVGGRKSSRQLEAFNMSGYLAQLEPEKQKRALNSLQEIVMDSLLTLQEGQVPEAPVFRFYSEAKILVVIGTPEALEAARKIIQALPGQQPVKESKMVDILELNK